MEFAEPGLRLTPEAEVASFASAGLHKDPNLYPGERPKDSYLTDGESVYALHVRNVDGELRFSLPTEDGEADIDDYLQQHRVASMQDRIPVLAFGANMCPASLLAKYSKVGRPDALIVPTVYAELPGYDVVWSGGPGVNGNFIAMLYKGEETKSTAVQVGVSFLTSEQLLVMHATELSYDLSAVPVKIGDKEVQAYYYAGVDSVYLEGDQPVAIEAIPAKGRALQESTTRALMDKLVTDRELLTSVYAEHPELANVTSSVGYIQYAHDLLAKRGKGARLALKQLVHATLAANGRSKLNESVDGLQNRASWANPSTLATFGQQARGIRHNDLYRLPQQEILPKKAWPDPVARQRVLGAVSTHMIRTSSDQLRTRRDNL